MGYFSKTEEMLSIDLLNLPEEADHNIRTCQLGAFWGVKSHFTTNTSPAIVSIPTGGGKTALMMMLAFGLEGDQVLVITPSDVLREQTRQKFQTLEGLREQEADILREDIEKPSVAVAEERVTSQSQWESLLKHDVVVALPDNISTVHSDDIVPPSVDDFDLVFIDEAHHTQAYSWRKLVNDLEGAKQILLTATPFRRDRRTLPGDLVYHYPVTQAIADGIYEPIKYEPINRVPDEERDAQLCKAAKEKLSELNENRSDDEQLQILAKTRTIKHARNLVNSYGDVGLNLEPVHSSRDEDDNEQAKEDLDSGEIDGVIVVGMMGEGLDVDSLAVAVLHDPPQSFPLTLQLIGRVARPVEGASAVIIADPSDLVDQKKVKDKVQRLYQQRDGWGELINDLVNEVIKKDEHLDLPKAEALNIPAGNIRPYFSAQLYSTNESRLKMGAENIIKIKGGVVERLGVFDEQNNILCLISKTYRRPPWSTGILPYTTDFDIHIYYYHYGSRVLFEHTTSDRIARQIRLQIAGGTRPIRGAPLASLLQEDILSEYLTAGLQGSPAAVGGSPNYKMYMGQRAENAINPSDQDSFAHGHSFTRIEGGDLYDESDVNTLGVSEKQGSVWSSGRGSIEEYKLWCERIARRLDRNADLIEIEGIGLRVTKDIDSFPQDEETDIKLLYVGLDSEMLLNNVRVSQRDDDSIGRRLNNPEFEILNRGVEGKRRVTLLFYPKPDAEPIECKYYIRRDKWRGDITEYSFRVDSGAGMEIAEIPGAQFFDRYLPEFFLSNGDVIRGGQLFERDIGKSKLPESCFDKNEKIDWSNCDRTAESNEANVSDGQQSLHDWVQSYIVRTGADDQIVFKDHQQGEIADFIEINGVDKSLEHQKKISFYHCKVTTKNKGRDPSIGAKQKHVSDALYQLHRTLGWVENRQLLEHIPRREREATKPHFVTGRELFDTFCDEFKVGEWKYEVVLVNPCLDYQEAIEDQNVNLILRACHETLDIDGANIDFRIIGHQGE